MTILFLPSWYPNRKRRYDGNFIENHAKAVSLYHQVIVLFVTSDPEIISRDVTISENKLLKEIIIYYPSHPLILVRAFRKWRAYLAGIRIVGSFDIIHTHVFSPISILGVILAKMKVPIVHTEHSSFFHLLPRWKRACFQFVAKLISYHTPVSKDLENTLVRYGVHSDQITIIANTIDTDLFQLKQNTTCHETQRFLHISAYEDPRKNLVGILNVFQKLDRQGLNFHLEIGGDGDYSWLQRTVSLYNISPAKISLHQKYSNKEIVESYQRADFFVLFSQFENFGMVLAESILCGTPVISTRVGGTVDIVEEPNGFLIERGNEKQLYDLISSLIQNTPFFNPTAVRSSISGRFSMETIGNQLSLIYKKLLKEHRSV